MNVYYAERQISVPTTAQENRRPCSEKTKVYIAEALNLYETLPILEQAKGDQDKSWAPHVVCSACVKELRQWFQGKKKSFRFAVPVIWSEPKNHSDDCYFCSCSVQGFNLKNRKDISYPTIILSAIRPVPQGPDLPILSPPDTLDNILDDLDQISHISSNSDDGYDPGTNDPELFS
ncbi:uncharacterized protein TNCV_2885831 [Trichonephila clavipes]|nr:uncharacterized protein TNCV_2885831 [Trichonephila clavipes]